MKPCRIKLADTTEIYAGFLFKSHAWETKYVNLNSKRVIFNH